MKTAVLICPGRGTYTKTELGSLAHFPDRALLDQMDDKRESLGQESLTTLDSAPNYSVARHSRGDNASALIYAATYGDFLALKGVDVVAVTGNSMGWYSALAVAGALDAMAGFELVNTMGRLMQNHLIGGQIIYPFMSEDWRPAPTRRAELLAKVAEIDARPDHALSLSIDLGGFLVLAGNEAGLAAFETSVPSAQGRFPMRIANHAGFHSDLQEPVAALGRAALPLEMFGMPRLPLIDGRGHIWWPNACTTSTLREYTLGHQVVRPYDFTAAIRTAAREFAPDLFIVTGPGTTLGGAVAQSLILANWCSMTDKISFQERQVASPLLISMSLPDQRVLVT